MGLDNYVWQVLTAVWLVTGEMAPYLLFGFLVAGVLSVIVSPRWVERHLGGRGLLPVFKGVLFGVPLPLCSCGVIPVTASIRSHGASRGATTGFLLATPQTGVDSIFATWGMLGPVIGIFRPLAALITGMIGGGLVSLLVREDDRENENKNVSADNAKPENAKSNSTGGNSGTWREKLVQALRYGLIVLPGDLGKPLLVGILIAGAIGALVPENLFADYLGQGWLAMLAVMLLAIPAYVCSTASIPIAVGLVHLGASPGAALVFLIAGPATNAATITMAWKVLGRRTTIIYLATVGIGAMASGAILDVIYRHIDIADVFQQSHLHATSLHWYHHLMAAVLMLVLIVAQLAERAKTRRQTTDVLPQGESVTLRVAGMTCSHCVESMVRTLEEIPGVRAVNVDLSTGLVIVIGDDLNKEAIEQAITRLGYKASSNID